MVEIIEVKSKRDIKDFISFPLKLYKGCPYFVPVIYGDEKKLLTSGGNTKDCESVFFLARRGEKTVGRIQGILHKQHNELKNEKRVRFTRFDSINDKEVSSALFEAVEKWAISKGMEQICGPLGYSDLDREGLLVWGFQENSTYEEQYNYEYYPDLVEDFGFEKEVDWLEFELTPPEKKNEMLARVAKRALEINKLHIADTNMPKKKFIEKYADSLFDTIDICYSKLYGTMPISQEERKKLIGDFYMVVNVKQLVFICNEQDEVVAFGLAFPSFGDALKKSGGRLTPLTILKLLKALKKPKAIDLGLVGIRPEYQNSGLVAVIIQGMLDFFENGGIEKCETNLNLETNTSIISQWKYFTSRNHKRRRAYLKTIDKEKYNA